MYKRDWARVHATYSKRLVLMISFFGRMMTRDFYETDLSSSMSSVL